MRRYVGASEAHTQATRSCMGTFVYCAEYLYSRYVYPILENTCDCFPHTDLEEDHPNSVNIVLFVERYCRNTLPVWMSVQIGARIELGLQRRSGLIWTGVFEALVIDDKIVRRMDEATQCNRLDLRYKDNIPAPNTFVNPAAFVDIHRGESPGATSHHLYVART